MSTIPEEAYQFKNLVLSDKYLDEQSKLAAIIGVDDNGEPILFDFAKQPHLFIGGDQGCGKSTLIHSIIMSLMQRNSPEEFQFVYLDAKVVESKLYFASKYLNFFASNPTEAIKHLKNVRDNRLQALYQNRKRSIQEYNFIADACEDVEHIPELFVFIDELSLIAEQDEIIENILSLLVDGRTTGIHFLISDTNPTLKNISKISTEFPNKVLFRYTYADYKVLLGKNTIVPLQDDGEILCSFGSANYIHGHACFVGIDEVKSKVSEMVDTKKDFKEKVDKVLRVSFPSAYSQSDFEEEEDLWDPLLCDAAVIAVKNKGLMTTDLQKVLKVGYARASRIIDQLEEKGIIGYSQGAKPRECFINSVEELKKALGEEYAVDKETEANLFAETVKEIVTEAREDTTAEQIDSFEELSKTERFSQFISRYKNIAIYIVATVVVIMAIYFVLNIPRETVEKFMPKIIGYGFLPACIIFGIWKSKRKKIKRYSIYAIDNISDGHTFEYVVADLLKGVGFYNVKVTVGSGDYGIDVVGWYEGASYAIQCKKYSGKVGVSAVQEAYAGRSYYGCNYAMVITNNYFTPAAIKLAKSTGVILWDRNNVKKLLNGHI